MGGETEAAKIFEEARPALTGLAYRILASYAEAEDVVQDCFLAWQTADRDAIDRPRSWLMTVCSRKAIDVLRSARRARTSYVGPWLPEPVRTDFFEAPQETAAALSDTVTTSFLLVLERLSPKERAAFLLRDVFDMDYADIAVGLDVSEPACRKLVSRARANVRQPENAHTVPRERQETLIAAFEQAIRTGDTEPLAALLSADATLHADGGGKVPSARKPLEGAPVVLAFVRKVLSRAWRDYAIEMRIAEVNAGLALIAYQDGVPSAAVTFAFDRDQKVTDVYIVRNPDKLGRIDDAGPGGKAAPSP
jgi:RNA polymerase sigma-70 factor, ECF subfamily